jgi:hypothetical protein
MPWSRLSGCCEQELTAAQKKKLKKAKERENKKGGNMRVCVTLCSHTLINVNRVCCQQELTAAQKKKLKKKAKEKEKKKGGGAEGEEGEEGAEAKKDKKPAKPQSAAVRRLQEELERKRIAEEQRIREEEERIRQVRIRLCVPTSNT